MLSRAARATLSAMQPIPNCKVEPSSIKAATFWPIWSSASPAAGIEAMRYVKEGERISVIAA